MRTLCLSYEPLPAEAKLDCTSRPAEIRWSGGMGPRERGPGRGSRGGLYLGFKGIKVEASDIFDVAYYGLR